MANAAKLYRCMNDECKPDDAHSAGFDYSGERACPKCGLDSGNVVERARVHLLIRDPAGPVKGHMGKTFKVACDPTRKKITEKPNEFASGEPAAVTCPECLAVHAQAQAEQGV